MYAMRPNYNTMVAVRILKKLPISSIMWLLSQESLIYSYLVEVPEVEPAGPVDGGKEGRVDGRPGHVVNVVTVILHFVINW